MRSITLDASGALAWLHDENRPAWVDRLMSDARHGEVNLMVPSLFWLEVGNTLARDRSLTDEQAIDGLLRFESLGVETLDVDPPLRLRALKLARQTGLTMCDAIYLGLADTTGAPLATLDARLADVAGSSGIGVDGGPASVSEDLSPYGQRAADAVSLAAIGAALAELRKQYGST